MLTITPKFIEDLKINDKNPKFYQNYPELFTSYFQNIDYEIIKELSDAGYLYYHSVLFMDSLLDEKDFSKVSLIQIFQEESIKKLTSIFSKNSEFWDFWNKRRTEYFEAIKIEKSLNYKDNVDFSIYSDLADKKSAFGKIAIDSMYLLSNQQNKDIYEKLILSHYYFSVGFQLYDDLMDFKTDYLKNQFNWAIYKLKQLIDFDGYNNDLVKLHKLLYIKKVGQEILLKSCEYLQKSIDLLNELNIKSDWLKINLEKQKNTESLFYSTIGYIQTLQKKIKVKNQKNIKNLFFDYSEIKNSIFFNALKFIENDYKENFIELKHFMFLGGFEGFQNTSEVHCSDIFARALLNDCFLNISNKFNLDLKNYFNFECNYFIENSNKDEIGGWSYFSTLQENAADIDDLGQIIQFFIGIKRLDLVETYCLKPIQVALNDRVCSNGGIETWIIPKENQTEIQKKQEYFNATKWGKGPDLEVVANFIYSLQKLNPEKYFIEIQNALNYIVENQNKEGFWLSRWYYGNYYGTYISLRLLKEFGNQFSEQINLALTYILESQNEDGGFSSDENKNSDALSSSFALLSLKLFFSKENENIKKIENYLINTQEKTGNWQEINFIKPRANQPYKSKTLTTAFVLNALI